MSTQTKPPADKPHYHGHRGRLRGRFLEGGAEALQDYELLELFLTFAIPYSDVKPLAKALITRFGSFSQVLDAPLEALLEVRTQDTKGRTQRLTELSATLLLVVKATVETYLKEAALKRQSIPSLEVLVDYCRTAMGGLKDEQFRVLYLNSQNEIIAEEIIQEEHRQPDGGLSPQDPRAGPEHKATGLILVHNHPKPEPQPLRLGQGTDPQTVVKASQALNLTVHYTYLTPSAATVITAWRAA